MGDENPTSYEGPKFELATFVKAKAAKKGGEVVVGAAGAFIVAQGLAEVGLKIIDGHVCLNPATLIASILGGVFLPVLTNVWTHRDKLRARPLGS